MVSNSRSASLPNAVTCRLPFSRAIAAGSNLVSAKLWVRVIAKVPSSAAVTTRVGCWYNLAPCPPIKECLREAASSLVVAAALFSGMPVGCPSHFECPEIQPANPQLSLHLQLHREGYSLRSEASARMDSGAAD